jgi:hypothetical protein
MRPKKRRRQKPIRRDVGSLCAKLADITIPITAVRDWMTSISLGWVLWRIRLRSIKRISLARLNCEERLFILDSVKAQVVPIFS